MGIRRSPRRAWRSRRGRLHRRGGDIAARQAIGPEAVWVAGSRSVPNWLSDSGIEVRRTAPSDIIPILNSCATPQHEVLETFRWMRALLAEGKATPEQIGITAASPADFDDHVHAFSQDANIPLHFVHGIKAAATPDGQTAAALADILVKGISQERVRRLFRRLHGAPALIGLPIQVSSILCARTSSSRAEAV